MKKSLLLISVAASVAVADTYSLGQINIEASVKDNTKVLHLQGNYIDNSKSIDNEVIESLSAGNSNYNESLKLMPSVSVETLDPYALTLDQNSIRVRGQFGDTFSKMSNTIGGVPFSISAGVGANGYLIDMNNIASVDFFAGASAPNVGLGFGNTAGSINMNLKSPKDDMGFEFEQAIGSDSFYKTFGRFDSGKINDMFGVFGSGSIASHDKWTGVGEVNRKNINTMVEIEISEDTQLSIFGAFNRFDRHEYKGLTYAETKDLKKNYKNDYNKNLTGTPTVDRYYYDFNKQAMDEYFTFINLSTKIDDTLISFKPYYFGNNGTRRIGNPMGFLEMDVAQDAYGSVIEINQPLAGGLLNIGWWYQKIDTAQPPASQKLYKMDYSTGTAIFAQNFMLTESGYTISTSPFVSYEKELGELHILAGARYLDFSFPSVSGTNQQNKEMYADAKHEKVFLPSLLLTYDVTNSIELRSSYHKAYANPRLGTTWQTFSSNMNKFQAKDITLQQLWNDLKLEIADNYEIGLMYKNDNWYVASNLYYTDVKNKQVAFTDNSDSSNVVSYYLSNASAESKGVEIESGISYDTLDLYASVYYNSYEFKNNINSATNNTLQSKGNQIPNTPAFGVKFGALYNIGDFRIMPTMKYSSKRYGDVEHKEQVDSYTTLDLGIEYRKKNVYNNMNLQIALDIQNIFDKKYIGNINNSLDDSKDGSTTYYQGAPLSAMLSLKLSY
ncbi:MAG: TonB-dependent receptor [Sulfurovum sp.]|nr:TonB-dependent receptor [Sulfurovum sp.]MDD3498775.1 TonB-dependent receptor [Sulfurovum sp.]